MEQRTRARQLRADPTDAEVRLWRAISARKIAGVRFNRQVPIGPFICDFVSRSTQLVIEVDGGQHAVRAAADASRMRYLECAGYRVIRFWNGDVLGNLAGVIAEIERVLAMPPPPAPPASGRGVKAMPDHATSPNPAVQAQLDRLWALSPGADILGLERIAALLARLGDPHDRLPPVLHVAGTNGKGSTCAFLRSAIEAAGLRTHVYTSPHLVRFNERIRIAGALIADDALAALLEEVLDVAGDIGASFFEVTTAAAFLAFSRTPADACIVEVGLGGRLDATNVIASPLVTGIAQLGIDHQSFLGHSAEQIAGEKAGIAKHGAPLVTMRYPPATAARVAEVAAAADACISALGSGWHMRVGETLRYTDENGTVETPLPTMAGPHQPENLALAIAMLRHQSVLDIPLAAYRAAATGTGWPARMQRLHAGPLTDMLPPGSQLWLDGGHNPAAATAIAATIAQIAHPGMGRSDVHLVLGMLANKDPAGLLAPLATLATTLHAVPTPGREHHAPAALAQVAHELGIAAHVASDVPAALRDIAAIGDPAEPPVVLILGSLYLAGSVLAANGEHPD